MGGKVEDREEHKGRKWVGRWKIEENKGEKKIEKEK